MNTRRLLCAFAVAAVLGGTLAAPAVALDINGTEGPDELAGTVGPDTIRGYQGDDTIRGRAGNDVLHGHRGADRIYAGVGADVGKGGGQRDRLFAGDDAKKDVVYGGRGSDRIVARTEDWVYAGAGRDRIVISRPKTGVTKVDCGPGVDWVTIKNTNEEFGWVPQWSNDCENYYHAP